MLSTSQLLTASPDEVLDKEFYINLSMGEITGKISKIELYTASTASEIQDELHIIGGEISPSEGYIIKDDVLTVSYVVIMFVIPEVEILSPTDIKLIFDLLLNPNIDVITFVDDKMHNICSLPNRTYRNSDIKHFATKCMENVIHARGKIDKFYVTASAGIWDYETLI